MRLQDVINSMQVVANQSPGIEVYLEVGGDGANHTGLFRAMEITDGRLTLRTEEVLFNVE